MRRRSRNSGDVIHRFSTGSHLPDTDAPGASTVARALDAVSGLQIPPAALMGRVSLSVGGNPQ
jgi:hypothetical protein